MLPVKYAGGKHSLRAYIAVCLQIHCNPSSYFMSRSYPFKRFLILCQHFHFQKRKQCSMRTFKIPTTSTLEITAVTICNFWGCGCHLTVHNNKTRLSRWLARGVAKGGRTDGRVSGRRAKPQSRGANNNYKILLQNSVRVRIILFYTHVSIAIFKRSLKTFLFEQITHSTH